MYKYFGVISIVLYTLLFLLPQQSMAEEALQCGIAKNYPPYQFVKEGKIAGFDADVLRLVVQRLEDDMVFYQKDWEHVFTQLRMNKLDCITGMEINDIRRRFFIFTQAYYAREEIIIVRADNNDVNELDDLKGKRIAGDKHSQIEVSLNKKGFFKQAKLMREEDKEQAMKLLKENKIQAIIIPKAVGMYAAKKHNVAIKTIFTMGDGSPVGFAFHKKNVALKERMDTALGELIKAGEITRLYDKWFK